MNIQEATKKAIAEDKCIARTDPKWPEGLEVKLTDTPDCCFLSYEDQAPRRGWQPAAEDLISDCWEIVS